MRVRVMPGQIKNRAADFRDELLQALKDNGSLKMEIEVSETTSNKDAKTGWTKLGQIQFDRALVSYGCDRRLHFGHPKQND